MSRILKEGSTPGGKKTVRSLLLPSDPRTNTPSIRVCDSTRVIDESRRYAEDCVIRESPSRNSESPDVVGFYHAKTGSIAYIVSDPLTHSTAIIDPVLDFDEKCGAVTASFANRLLAYVRDRDLDLVWILDTHPHADHFSAAAYLKRVTGAPMAIGRKIVEVQAIWKEIYALSTFNDDGSQWDHLLDDGDTFKLGGLNVQVIHSPGHTLASVTYVVGDAAFTHDTLFMPDSGTARCDFPGGDAHQLYRSIEEILSLHPNTRIFVGHDYRPGGRAAEWETSPAAQRRGNIHLKNGITEDKFVSLRERRDATLPLPSLMLFALQVNIQGGRMPASDTLGRLFLKFPLQDLTLSPV